MTRRMRESRWVIWSRDWEVRLPLVYTVLPLLIAGVVTVSWPLSFEEN